MRILLTGATGLIGQAMARVLRPDHDIITLGRRPQNDLRADLADPAAISRLDLPEIETLIHCAGVVDEDFRDNPEKAMQMAIFGADALVTAAIETGARRLVYVSSAHVYGPMQGHIDETTAPNPVSNYAIAHFATEQIFRRKTSDQISGLALRPCAVFGDLADPGAFRRWDLIPFSFPRAAARDGRIVIRSTGEQRRNFVGTEDIARTCNLWLTAPAKGWTTVNPRGTTDCSVLDLALLCADCTRIITGREIAIARVTPEGPTPGDDLDYQSLFPIAQGRQSLQETLMRLISLSERN